MTASEFIHNRPRLRKDLILLFDLDGTLLDTNLANNEAYRNAIWKVTGTSDYAIFSLLRRVTRENIASIKSITPDQLEEIVRQKKKYFPYRVQEGNTSAFVTLDILRRYSVSNSCYVITSADPDRARFLIQGYGINQWVKGVIYADRTDKYKDIASKLNVDASKIILFEDEKEAISNAISNGVQKSFIIPVSLNTLKIHLIKSNSYLKQNVRAYYSLDYLRYGHPENPDFINTLKNQYCDIPLDKVIAALEHLKVFLTRDIRCIYKMLGEKELMVVGVPRSKSECEYYSQQQFFRKGIHDVVIKLQLDEKLNLIDGSQFITRHTNTKTTHLSKNENVENDGEMPYPGITKDTCQISEQVAGKDILLIDDIYTSGVNIDEDAIQALYDMGAKSVFFYSVCKTFKRKKE